MIRGLALVACLLTLCITGSSAFIRHAKSGVGCDEWPACYRDAVSARTTASSPAAAGEIPASAAERIARALHRVSAMVVGVLVLVVAAFGWSSMSAGTRVVVAIGLADTLFLAWLGRLTPHALPLVTIGNLVGGLALTAVLAWIAAERPDRVPAPGPRAQRAPAGAPRASSSDTRAVAAVAFVALALLATSAWVGTMIGAHGAIDACATPGCFGGARFDAATLDPMRPAQALDAGSARGLHWLHRLLGAAFAAAVLAIAMRLRGQPVLVAALLAATLAQWLLGIGTALGTQPLFTTTAHNVVAAFLAVLLATVARRSAAAAKAQPRFSLA